MNGGAADDQQKRGEALQNLDAAAAKLLEASQLLEKAKDEAFAAGGLAEEAVDVLVRVKATRDRLNATPVGG